MIDMGIVQAMVHFLSMLWLIVQLLDLQILVLHYPKFIGSVIVISVLWGSQMRLPVEALRCQSLLV